MTRGPQRRRCRAAAAAAALALALAGGACLADSALGDTDTAGGIMIVEPANLPADGERAAEVTLLLRRRDGAPVAGANVDLGMGDCQVEVASQTTDAGGQAAWRVACSRPGIKVGSARLRLAGEQVALPQSVLLNVYLPADANGALPPNTPVSILAAARQDGRLTTDVAGQAVVTSSDPAARLPDPAALDGGVHLFFQAALLVTPGPQTLDVVEAASGRLLARESFLVGAPSGDVLLAAQLEPQRPAAGEAASLTVAAVDARGAPATAFAGELALLCSDARATFPGRLRLAAGAPARAAVTFSTLGEQVLQVVDVAGRLTSVSVGPFTVTPGPASQVRLELAPSARAGAPLDVSVRALDRFANPATGLADLLAFSSSDPRATLPAAFSLAGSAGGQVTLAAALQLRTVGPQTVSLADSSRPDLVGAQATVEVVAGAPASLGLATAATVTAGAPLDVQVTALDATAEVVAGYVGTINLSASDPRATVAPPLIFTGGDLGRQLVAAGVVFETAGTQSIAAVDATLAAVGGSRGGIVVAPAAATRLALTAAAGPWPSGVERSVTIEALDDFGNRQTAYAGGVALALSDAGGQVPAAAALVGGVAVVAATTRAVGSGSLTATDAAGVLAPATLALAQVPGPVASLSLTPGTAMEPATLSGFSDEITHLANVQVFDAAGNLATNAAGPYDILCEGPPSGCPAEYVLDVADAGHFAFAMPFHAPGWATVTVRPRAAPQVEVRAALNIVRPPNGEFDDSSDNDISQNDQGSSTAPALALDASGLPTVAWQDKRSGNQIYLRRFQAGAWTQLGGSGSGGGVSNLPGLNDQASVAIDPATSQPGVAWRNANALTGEAAIYYAQFEAGSGSWVGRGGSRSGGGISGDDTVVQGRPQLAFVGGQPWIAWQVEMGGDTVVRALAFDGSGWSPPGGSADVSAASGSTNVAPALAANAAGDVVLAWQSDAAGRPQIYLKSWAAGAWTELAGSASSAGVSQTAGQATLPRVALAPDGTIWVAWRDTSFADANFGSGSGQVLAKHFAAGAWVGVAGSSDPAGLSASLWDALSCDVAVGPGGAPVVLWTQHVAEIGLSQLMLRRLAGSIWEEVAGSGHGLGTSLGMIYRSDGDLLGRLATRADGSCVIGWAHNFFTFLNQQVRVVAYP